jgi:hypothetical protein
VAGFPARHPGHIYVWTEHLLEAEPPDGPLHRLGLDKLADLPRLLPGGATRPAAEQWLRAGGIRPTFRSAKW